MFDNKWIEVRAENYIFHEQDDNECTFLIMPVDSPINMMGMPLMMDYYTVFDHKQELISWAPHKYSMKGALVRGVLPSASQYLEAFIGPGVMPEIVHLGSLVISWLLALVITYGGYFFWNAKMKPTWKGFLDVMFY